MENKPTRSFHHTLHAYVKQRIGDKHNESKEEKAENWNQTQQDHKKKRTPNLSSIVEGRCRFTVVPSGLNDVL